MKLSVAIPTHNGSRYIQEALDSMISQLEDIDEEIEIVISDNASTDRTPEIIKEYQNRYSFIKYFRNDKNLGADRNFDLAVKRSRGKYIWLFSDDDKMLPGAIKKVLDVIKNHPGLAAIFVNWSNYSTDLKRCNIGRTIDIQKDIFFKAADDFLSVVKLNAVFVSSNIVCRSLWEQTNSERYIGSNWIHYATLLDLIIEKPSYCIAEPYVIYRTGNIHWDKHNVATNTKNTVSLMKILNDLREKGYSKMSVDKAIGVIVHHLPLEICGYKRRGVVLRGLYLKSMMKYFKFYPSFWLIDFPLLLLPNIFYEVLYRFILQAKRVKQVFSKNI